MEAIVPDCTFVYRPDYGNMYVVYSYNKNNTPIKRKEMTFFVAPMMRHLYVIFEDRRDKVYHSFSAESANTKAKDLAIKRARELARKQHITYIDNLVTDKSD